MFGTEDDLFDGDQPDKRIIEGVSDYVTVAIVSLIVFSVTVLYFYWRDRGTRRLSGIHPQMASDVADFRQMVNQGNIPTDEQSALRLQVARERTDRDCPICFGDASFAVLTNCGHLFCCECIIGYWRHSASLITPVSCAICRGAVTMLLPLDWPPIENTEDDDGLHENDIRLNDYNRRFSGERPWIEYLYDVPVLIPYALSHLTDMYGIGLLFRVRLAVCLITVAAYIFTPFDLLPESVYGLLGFLDDVFVVVLLAIYFAIMLRQFMASRGEARQEGVFQ